MDCVEVCPVDCFYEGENMLVIHPDECIDCGVCEPECPVEAIKPDTEPGAEKWLKLNADYAKTWPNITAFKRAPPANSRMGRQKPDKLEMFLSPNRAQATTARQLYPKRTSGKVPPGRMFLPAPPLSRGEQINYYLSVTVSKFAGSTISSKLAVVGIAAHRVLDLRRLDPARTGVKRVHALALELAREPALEHVDHLEVDVVIVRDRDFFRVERLGHADDVRLHHAAGRRRDAEIAIGRIGRRP